MPRILLLTFISVCIIITLLASYVLVQNLKLNYKIIRFQKNKSNKIFSLRLSLNFVLIVLFLVSPILVFNNRNEIYLNLYRDRNIDAICIDFGDDTDTPEDSIEYMDYVSIVKIGEHQHSDMFDILKEDDFPLPHVTEVYLFSELARLKGESSPLFIYNMNYLEKEGVYVSDTCDFVLDLEPGVVYLVIGNYSNGNSYIEGYDNGAYILKAVAIEDYDMEKTLDQQTQDIQYLVESLSTGTITSESD